MRLTPLGKIFLFLIGLGLVLTAVYKFVPREKLPWNRPRSASSSSDVMPSATEPSASATDANARSADGSSGGALWIDVPAGVFLSGQNQETLDVPAYRIRRAEVTNGEYEAFLKDCPVGSSCGPRELPSYWDDSDYLETHRDHPVVFVSWGDGSAYCKQQGGRLPTIAEWEKAARGTDGRDFPTGSALDPSAVNILGSNHDKKNEAEKQIPTWATTDPNYGRDKSPYGVLAMAGNVSEWTASASPDEPDLRLVAGGSWDSWDLGDGRTYNRIPKPPTDRSSSVGFRCATGASSH
ncbi:MAG TPA: formylglycine-generating enzyme family protein [Thermoanaerobaculia bacterium]|nr:formylglycine-generating enzyme family protein [Thermoanaerobaculia bacterium]